MNLICVGAEPWLPGLAERHTLIGLARKGHRILYLEPPPAQEPAGPLSLDAGPALLDAGPALLDAGPALLDAGPGTLYIAHSLTGRMLAELQFQEALVLLFTREWQCWSALEAYPKLFLGRIPPRAISEIAEENATEWNAARGGGRDAVAETAGAALRLALAASEHQQQQLHQLEDRMAVALQAAPGNHPGPTRGRTGTLALPGSAVARLWPEPVERLEEHGQRWEMQESATFHALCTVTAWAGRLMYPARVALRKLGRRRHPEVRKILVGRKAAMGDLIMLTPMLHVLRKRYPEARIVVAVQKGMFAGDLLEHSPLVDEIREISFLSTGSALTKLLGSLRLLAEGFDVTFSGYTYFLLREVQLAGSPRRYGYYNGVALQTKNTAVLPADLTVHEAEANVALVEMLTGQREHRGRSPALALDEPRVERETRLLLAAAGVNEQTAIVTMHAGSKNPTRRWPAERFASVAKKLLAGNGGLHIVLTGSEGERELVAGIQDSLPPELRHRVSSVAGSTTLHSLWGLLRRSRLVLSNDTGVMHLARCAGAPLLALLGPENDSRWSPHPWGAAPALALRNVVPCAPCSRVACEALYCLRTLDENVVLEEIAGMLRENRLEEPQRLRRRTWEWNWNMLDEAGMPPPSMSVLCVDARTASPAVEAMLARQSYPRFDVVEIGRGTSWPAAVQRALSDSTGGLLAVLTPLCQWQREHLSAHAAAMMRSPGADFSLNQRRRGVEAPLYEGLPCGITVRRTALERAARNGLERGAARNDPSLISTLRHLIQKGSATSADVPQDASVLVGRARR